MKKLWRRSRASYLILIGLAWSLVSSCQGPGTSPAPWTGMTGRVYSIGAPAVPVDWKPPPLELVSTILVSDREFAPFDPDYAPVTTVKTDAQGRFEIAVPEGVYFLRVAESPSPEESGPYVVTAGSRLVAAAYFDNGVR